MASRGATFQSTQTPPPGQRVANVTAPRTACPPTSRRRNVCAAAGAATATRTAAAIARRTGRDTEAIRDTEWRRHHKTAPHVPSGRTRRRTSARRSLLLTVDAGLLTRWIPFWFGTMTRVFDPVADVLGVAVIVAACAAAATIPTRRAMRMNPVETLKSE